MNNNIKNFCEEYTEKAIETLRLGDWGISLHFIDTITDVEDKQLGDGGAYAFYNTYTRIATIGLDMTKLDTTRECAKSILHELLHIYFTRLDILGDTHRNIEFVINTLCDAIIEGELK